MDLPEITCNNITWIEVAWDQVWWSSFVEKIMNI